MPSWMEDSSSAPHVVESGGDQFRILGGLSRSELPRRGSEEFGSPSMSGPIAFAQSRCGVQVMLYQDRSGTRDFYLKELRSGRS